MGKREPVLDVVNSGVETVDAFHRMYYESSVWAGGTTWRGHRIEKFPTDLVIYQEIIWNLRPDVIIECGTRFGGSAVFLGDMCQLAGHGRVVSFDVDAAETPEHPLVTYVQGDSTAVQNLEHCKGAERVLVILDSDHSKQHVLKELDLWSQVVSSGSYLIVEDTNISGHPVCREMEEGPWEAVEEWLPLHPEFEVDSTKEKFFLTTNPRGYLRKS